MAAAFDPLSMPALPAPAEELSDYPQFTPFVIPAGSGAARAFSGVLRPFSDDATARRVLCAIEDRIPIEISGGRLDIANGELRTHPLHRFLVNMAVPCRVLILEFPGREHPRAYLLDPAMVPRLSECEHLRPDKSIQIDGVRFPALCVYSGNLIQFDPGRSRLEQFLDQTATYIAKYMIWLRTRALYVRAPDGIRLVRPRNMSTTVAAVELSRSPQHFWRGYWPGPSAPSAPWQHLATISPEVECWCWSGKPYGECHRLQELAYVERAKYEWNLQLFTRRFMAAVRLRLQ